MPDAIRKASETLEERGTTPDYFGPEGRKNTTLVAGAKGATTKIVFNRHKGAGVLKRTVIIFIDLAAESHFSKLRGRLASA